MSTCTTCSREIPATSAYCPACGSPNPDREGSRSGESDTALMQRRLQAALGDGFTVEGPLGEGGFAIVFAVYDRKLSRRIAVKVLRPELTASRASKQRFVREAESVARLNHPHILPIFFVGENQGLAYFGMPLVEGETLEAAMRREGKLGEAEAARIGAEVADALAEAHAAGLVHRDIKPLNVMLHGARRRVLVADFGIAKAAEGSGEDKLTGTGIAIGSPHYMSPEQAAGEELVDHRSDIYSLGILLWQMLAGELPFGSGGSRAVLMQQVSREVPDITTRRKDLSPAMVAAVTKCVAKRREDRFQSAIEVAQALHGLSSGGFPAILPGRRRFSRKWIAAATLVFGFGLFGGVYWLVKTTERAAANAEGPRDTGASVTAAPATSAPAIAVLPFATVGAGDTAFGRSAALMLGEALALRNGVTTVDGNNLLSRWIGERRNTTAPLDSNARFAYTLGANQMVLGNYVESGRSFRLTLSLYDTHDLARLWNGEITGSVDSLFPLLDQLATRVALALCDQPDYNPGGICFDAAPRPRTPLAITADSARDPLAFFAHIAATGEVDDVRLGAGAGESDVADRALATLQSTEFAPATRRGRPVAAWTSVSIEITPAASAVTLAEGCANPDYGVRNENRICYDTRPAPLQAPVVTVPGSCTATPTPVTLLVRVDSAGAVVGSPEVQSPSDCAAFTEAVRAAAAGITFSPAVKAGRAVGAWTKVLAQPAASAGGR